MQEIKIAGLGGEIIINLFSPFNSIESLKQELEFIVQEFENNYSRFIDNSYLYILNKNKILKNFPKEFYELLVFAKKAGRLSHGNINIGVGKFLSQIGYDKDYSFEEKAKSKIAEIVDSIITLHPSEIRIAENVEIDLGSFGKGWLVDKLSSFLKDKRINEFFVNAGGDIYATSQNKGYVTFKLENPLNIKEQIGSIQIKNAAIASSSASRRNWLTKNTKTRYHHLINPKRQTTPKLLAAVFTFGKATLECDAASTAIFVADPNQWESIAKSFEVEYLAVFSNGKFIKSPKYPGKLNL